MLPIRKRFRSPEAHVADSNLTSILSRINPAGPGPDAPLFSTADMQRLASLPSSENQLLSLVRDNNSEQATRFLAAEALVEGNWKEWRIQSADRAAVARVLAEALANDASHNRWGLPGSFVGPFSKRLLSLGTEAEAALVRLLGDSRPLNIEGSEAATLNSQFHFRVSDLASWLIATARQTPWQPSQVPSERDAATIALRNRIR